MRIYSALRSVLGVGLALVLGYEALEAADAPPRVALEAADAPLRVALEALDAPLRVDLEAEDTPRVVLEAAVCS